MFVIHLNLNENNVDKDNLLTYAWLAYNWLSIF